MSDYKQEIMEFRKILNDSSYEIGVGPRKQEALESFLSQALERVEKEGYEEGFLEGHVKGFIDGQKAKAGLLSPSGEKEVVRWKNTFVKGHLENMEEASKLSELLFPVEEEKKYCECHCHYESPCEGFEAHCTHCLPKKEKRERNRLFGSIKEG